MTVEQQGESSAPTRARPAPDERSFAELYERWSPFVYSVALRSLHDVEDAEEATLQVFTRAWSSGHPLELGDGAPPAWLVAILREQLAASGPPAPTDQVVALDGLARLDAGPRQALQLALHHDLDHREIAARMGQSATDIRRHLRRGLDALRDRLEVQTDAR